jgi:hypothetical protein
MNPLTARKFKYLSEIVDNRLLKIGIYFESFEFIHSQNITSRMRK